jgi:FixJ family two-component response regulator
MVGELWETVAIVDDDTAVLESFQFMLEMAGFPVAAYRSAKAFLRDTQTTPCCLIVDLNMPCMTGLELAARLRAEGNAVPVLLVSSSPSPASIARALDIGLSGIMEKPLREDEVIAFIRSCAVGTDRSAISPPGTGPH